MSTNKDGAMIGGWVVEVVLLMENGCAWRGHYLAAFAERPLAEKAVRHRVSLSDGVQVQAIASLGTDEMRIRCLPPGTVRRILVQSTLSLSI